MIDLSAEGEIIAPVPFLITANKMDLPGSKDNLEILSELKPDLRSPVSRAPDRVGRFKEKLFAVLDIIRVYGKPLAAGGYGPPFILKQACCSRFCGSCP